MALIASRATPRASNDLNASAHAEEASALNNASKPDCFFRRSMASKTQARSSGRRCEMCDQAAAGTIALISASSK
eukprot:6951643-Pyramimonas_sp.AAC.1